ncbi:MAG: ATP-dependent DNA ligase [Flavobacteriales bacterium]|nr:ATP-dependent DNA ligase [Flavobacteriales bacterium]
MKAFAALFEALDQTNKTQEKINILAEYLLHASDEDRLWTIALFTGRKPTRIANTTQLRNWAACAAGLPNWLVEATWHTVGDLGETLAGILPEPDVTTIPLNSLAATIQQIFQIHALNSEEAKAAAVITMWKQLSKTERFLFNKLIAGSLRIGVSQGLLIKAISQAFQLPENIIAHRLMGNWDPRTTTFQQLILHPQASDQLSKPYPFFLAYSLEDISQIQSNLSEWVAEHKWDGIRAQLIVRNNQLFVWTRGEELVTDRYPEFHPLLSQIPSGTVIDGEILAWRNNKPLPFQFLQKRMGRKTPSKKLIEEIPVVLMAYDLLEHQGLDIRNEPLIHRKKILEKLVYNCNVNTLKLSEIFFAHSWESLLQERERSAEKGSEGLMLKHCDSVYGTGRKKNGWWKWKVDPLTIDAVMIYAQSGHGRRAGLFTDYTFAVWDDQRKLVPIAKAYSGLSDDEILQLDRWIKQHTLEKFGPVRSVEPLQVFELAFEGIQTSTRHKSGIALRFPRIARWRTDKKAEDANTLADLKALISIV